MNEDTIRGTAFTDNAWDALYGAVDSREFIDNDAPVIYEALSAKLSFIPFGDYLKRYIHRRSRMTVPLSQVELNDYRRIIRDSFAERLTPPSFEPTTAKLSALSKNWLTQQTVSRKVVFLLGFGLGMNERDVEEFLTKALREQGVNPKDPFEVICWYCFRNGYGFPKFEALWKAYTETPKDSIGFGVLLDEGTVGLRREARGLAEDAELLNYLSKLKNDENISNSSASIRRAFDELFQKAREITAKLLTEENEDKAHILAGRKETRLQYDDDKPDYQKQRIVEHARSSYRRYAPEDITEGDIEHIISSAIPVDRNGNLTPAKASKLNAQFDGKRFSRQHISEVRLGKADANRFDLITLNFYIMSQSLEEHPDPKERLFAFMEKTDALLERCFLCGLLVSNPYECFVMMCLLSSDPLGAYADVWELSYGEE